MNSNQILLTKLLSAAIKNKSIEDLNIESADWHAIYEEAKAHEVHTIIYPLIKELKPNGCSTLMYKWKNNALLSGITQINHIKQINILFIEFNKSKISYIPLKGLILREYYPTPELRTMGDGDILVHHEDMQKACNIISKLGYKKQSTDTKHIHFIHDTHLPIEIHFLLIDKGSLNKNTADFEENVWKNALHSQVCGIPSMILSRENQILHLILHMAVHLATSGFGLRQLCDLTLLMEVNKNEINWQEVSKKTNEYGITRFTSALFIVCSKLFNTYIPEAFRDYFVDENCISDLIDDIFTGGVFGVRTQDRELGSINVRYINTEKESFSNRISLLFPKVINLGKQYSYAVKHPVLTPVAWVHRLIYSFFRSDYTLSEKISVLVPSKKASEVIINRTKLLHLLELK